MPKRNNDAFKHGTAGQIAASVQKETQAYPPSQLKKKAAQEKRKSDSVDWRGRGSKEIWVQKRRHEVLTAYYLKSKKAKQY